MSSRLTKHELDAARAKYRGEIIPAQSKRRLRRLGLLTDLMHDQIHPFKES
jgi:hypothetical protein